MQSTCIILRESGVHQRRDNVPQSKHDGLRIVSMACQMGKKLHGENMRRAFVQLRYLDKGIGETIVSDKMKLENEKIGKTG